MNRKHSIKNNRNITQKIIISSVCLLFLTGMCACQKQKDSENSDNLVQNHAQIESISPATTEEPVILPDLNVTFSTWQEAYTIYIDYLIKKGISAKNTEDAESIYRYALVYLDDDDIPELYFLSCSDSTGEAVATWHDNHLVTLELSNTSAADYIEKSGLLYHHPSKATNSPVTVYELKNGAFQKIASGAYRWDSTKSDDDRISMDSQNRPANIYEWEGKSVSEQEFDQKLNAVFDTKNSQRPENWYPTDEILAVLETGAHLSANHRYELITADVSWTEAQTLCQEKGGYLATITAPEERQAILELMKQDEKTDIRFFVGYRKQEEIDGQSLKDRWINADGTETPAGNLPGFWEHQAPDYNFIMPEFEVQECGILKYYPETDKIYLFSAPDELISTLADYAGKIGYVCEYDN